MFGFCENIEPQLLPMQQWWRSRSRRQFYHFVIAVWREKQAESAAWSNWEIIADNLSKAGWSWGCVSAVDSCGRTIFIADAHRGGHKTLW